MLALTLFATASCNDALEPSFRGIDDDRGAQANSTPSWSTSVTIPVPPQNQPNYGAVSRFPVSAPDSVWVKMRVTGGGIGLTVNPLYQSICTAQNTCGTLYDGQTFGPNGEQVAGQNQRALAVWAEINTLLVTFNADGTPTKFAYAWIPKGHVLYVQRTGLPGGATCPTGMSCAPGSFVPAYSFTGSQQLAVEQVAPPLHITAPEAVLASDTAVFSAQQDAQVDGVQWFFIPGDTLPTPQNPASLQSYRVWECAQGSMTCRYKLPRSGRMYVSGGIYGLWSVRDISGPVRVEPLRASVNCTPTVVRGSDVSCQATVTPSSVPTAQLTFRWRFEPDSVRVFPAANAQPFDPPPARDTTVQGMSTWSGPAALGGRVIVRVTYLTQASSDTSQFAVSGRTGASFGDLPVTFASGIADIVTDLSQPLVSQPNPEGGSAGMVGQNYDTHTGMGAITYAINGGPTFARAGSGPNQGLWYVVDPGVTSTRGIRLRTWLTGRESPQFDYSLAPGGLLTNRGLLAARRASLTSTAPVHVDSTAFLDGVTAHESYGTGGNKGHQGQIEVAAKSLQSCGRVPEILEAVVAGDSGTARLIANEVIEEGKKSLYAASWHDHVYGNYSNAPFYEVVPTVTVADALTWKVALGDTQQGAHPALAPSATSRCNRIY